MVPRFSARDHLRPQVTTEYRLEWCAGCAFGTVAGSFTPSDVSSFYTPDYYTHITSNGSQAASMRMLDRLRVHFAWRTDRGVDLTPSEVPRSHPAPTLCDVGCGAGQSMAAFKSKGYEVMGIEPDPSARALSAKVGEVLDGTAEAIPEAIEGRQFDAVLLSHVLEHCIHPAAALKNVKLLLAPQGTAVIEVPNNAAAGFEMYGPGWFFLDIPRHLQFFTEKSLRLALENAGLRVTRVYYTGYTRQFSPQWLAAQRQIRANIGIENDRKWAGSAAKLLMRTRHAQPAQKYDSIRVHAMHRA
jgi:2-polyprenyl-3-methyl-5-hydroxy-6-metoxy-1,4-benzoquinol methylase